MCEIKLGHVQLKVSDLRRAVDFYCNIFNMHVVEMVGDQFAFLSIDDSHHQIALQAVGSQPFTPHTCSPGLHHIAFEVPDQRTYVAAYRRLRTANVCVEAVNHLISLSLYFCDPDGNGLEIYWDTRYQGQGSTYWRGRSYIVRVDSLSERCNSSQTTHLGVLTVND